jgi:hypothetical protein
MLENLDGIIRAYVHCDYTSKNPPQHQQRTRQGSNPMIVVRGTDSAPQSPLSVAGSTTPTAANPLGKGLPFKGSQAAISESPGH